MRCKNFLLIAGSAISVYVLARAGRYLLDLYPTYLPGGLLIWLSGACAALFSVYVPEIGQKKSAQRGDGPD